MFHYLLTLLFCCSSKTKRLVDARSFFISISCIIDLLQPCAQQGNHRVAMTPLHLTAASRPTAAASRPVSLGQCRRAELEVEVLSKWRPA